MRNSLLPVVAALAFLTAACQPSGDDDDSAAPDAGTPDAGMPDAGPPPPTIPFSCILDGGSVETGLNTWTVGGLSRKFYADFPTASGTTPVGVVFSWHGVGDSASAWRTAVALDPDADPELPYVAITPEDTNLQPNSTPPGLDWEMFISRRGDSNREAALFEAVLGCLARDHAVDARRIYSFGFSGGAIVTNMLASRYPDVLAASIAMSGAWFNDGDEVALIDPTHRAASYGIVLEPDWDPLAPTDRRAVLISHGGSQDGVDMMGIPVLNFEDCAQAALPFLVGADRAVVDCPHTQGHAPHPSLAVADYTAFFKAHPLGVASPFTADTLPGALATACTLHLP